MQKIIYDIIHGNIEYSNFEGILLKNPIVNRLHQILQNSTAYRVYPNLKTSRFEHSLGVMNYSGKMYRFGLLNSDREDEFFQEMLNRLKSLVNKNGKKTFNNLGQPDYIRKFENHIKERYKLNDFNGGLSEILENPAFINDLKLFVGESFIKRNVNPTKDKFEGINILLYQSVRFFGLTHDIGHLPLSHLFEFALEGVYEKLADNSNRNSLQEEYFKKLKNLLETKGGQKDKIHEIIGKKISKFIFHEIRMDYAKSYNSDHNPDNIVSILITYFIQLIWKEMTRGYSGCFNSVYSIVAGTIDSDRLDFVRRDGYLSGVLKSPGNIDRIIEMCCLGKKAANMRGRFDDEYSFMPSVQSLNDVEEVLHHRFRIYKYVVNHHAVRRSDYIFQKVIENKLLQELERSENTEENSLLPSKLITVVDIADKILNDDEVNIDEMKDDIRKLTQLTDFWLLSVLNKDYISFCENEPEEKEINKTTYEYLLLSEVYENRKKFKSLWKRTHQFRDFLILLAQDFCQQKIDVSAIVDAKSQFLSLYNHCLAKYHKTNELEKCKIEIEAIEKDINEGNFDEKKEELIDLYQSRKIIESQYAQLGYEILSYVDFSSNIVHKIEKEFLQDGFFVLLRKAHLKSGIKTFELINRNRQEEIMEFKFFSHKEETINNEIKKSITFFVYYIENDEKTSNIVLQKLIQKINTLSQVKLTQK